MKGINKKKPIIIGTVLTGLYVVMRIIARKKTEEISIDEDNPYFRSVLRNNCTEVNGESVNSDLQDFSHNKICGGNTYTRTIKPFFDRVLSFVALIILAPIYVLIAIAIFIDDPGPVLFTQKRIGLHKHYMLIHKFRSMKMSAPHDVPTHQLSNPEIYITRVGKVLRSTSLDELPQIWDIFRGKMSIIGPRPALWNQDDLLAERDKYGSNDVMPGLTGLAQIRGRDELEIIDKARIDGEYTSSLLKSSWNGIAVDIACFFGTVVSVLRHNGVVEGGTGSIYERQSKQSASVQKKKDSNTHLRPGVPKEDPPIDWGYTKHFDIDTSKAVRVLITGANSYIGESFKTYAEKHYPSISVDTVDMIDGSWREYDFTSYDSVFHVAGIAHVDIEKASRAIQEKYYKVNTDLAIETAKKAKESCVKQFIFMSSMIIYGGVEYINEYTVPCPLNFYGDSKWQADKGVREIGSKEFRVVVLRPPMIYGKGSKGNYSTLSKLAKRIHVFPSINNKRSMLYIENLCELLSLLILSGQGGVYIPQNAEYSNTGEVMKQIGQAAGKRLKVTSILSPAVWLAFKIPGKVKGLVGKAFGSKWYDMRISKYNGLDYQKVSLAESIRLTER